MAVHVVRSAYDLKDPKTFTLDMDNPKPRDVEAIRDIFADNQNDPALKLPVKTGWNNITPAIAIDLLRRNPIGANRKLEPGTVIYYAEQMTEVDWKATGQPILVDKRGVLLDGQHRLYAALISGSTFRSYVVTDIEPEDDLFAYIDNSHTRTAAVALQTAGLNGVSPIIVKVIKIAEDVKRGGYNPSKKTRMSRLSPADALKLLKNYPGARAAARSAASDWADAVTFLGGSTYKDIVAYLGMRIADLHNEDVADEFYEAVAAIGKRSADDPIAALRKEIEKDNTKQKPMKKHHKLATLIKAFNAWYRKEPLPRRWLLQVNEDFPVIEGAEEKVEAEAAE